MKDYTEEAVAGTGRSRSLQGAVLKAPCAGGSPAQAGVRGSVGRRTIAPERRSMIRVCVSQALTLTPTLTLTLAPTPTQASSGALRSGEAHRDVRT